MPQFESIADRDDLTPEQKKAARDLKRANRASWIDVDISGKSVSERLERLEAIILGTVPPPTP